MNTADNKKVLFVCTGNYYRSRLAELLFNHYADEAGMGWTGDSRGVLERTAQRGLSPSAIRYLEGRELTHLIDESRSPKPLKLDHFEQFSVIVGMCRKEHSSLMLTRFGQIPRMLEKKGVLRYWNVDDLPTPSHLNGGLLQRLKVAFAGNDDHFGQREESGCEHVDFAVRALVRELAGDR